MPNLGLDLDVALGEGVVSLEVNQNWPINSNKIIIFVVHTFAYTLRSPRGTVSGLYSTKLTTRILVEWL